MPAKRIIPCLDIRDGRVVKGVHFRGLRDAGDPIARACFYDREGADELVLLHISPPSGDRRATIEIVRRIAGAISIPLTAGGGIGSVENMRELIDAGANKVSVGTAALENPALIRSGSDCFGGRRIVAAIDACRRSETKADRPAGKEPRWEVYSHGGRHPTGRDAVAWAMELEVLGAGEILLTSIDADGTGDGYDLELLAAVTGKVSIPVIASGGAGKLEHLAEALTAGGADAVLAASILHDGFFSITQIKTYLAGRGITVHQVAGHHLTGSRSSEELPKEAH